jgi:hypothetical protein
MSSDKDTLLILLTSIVKPPLITACPAFPCPPLLGVTLVRYSFAHFTASTTSSSDVAYTIPTGHAEKRSDAVLLLTPYVELPGYTIFPFILPSLCFSPRQELIPEV